MRRLLLLLLLSASPAAAATFGYTSVGASQDQVFAAFVWCKSNGVPSSNGALNSISIYGHTTGTATHRPALYSDTPGTPASRLAAINTGGSFNLGADDWISTDISYSGISNGTQYWLGTGQGFSNPDSGGANDLFFQYDSGSAGELYYRINQPIETWPDPIPAFDGNVPERVSIYATYTPDGTVFPSSYRQVVITGDDE